MRQVPTSRGKGAARPPACDRDRVLCELFKGIESEAARAERYEALAEHPPEPSLGVLYGEMAAADRRHRERLELVAIRYGHTPGHSPSGPIKGLVDRVKSLIPDVPTGPDQQVEADLAEKDAAIHRYHAWVHVFRAFGDEQSATEVEEILGEESGHCEMLQEALNRLVLEEIEGEHASEASDPLP